MSQSKIDHRCLPDPSVSVWTTCTDLYLPVIDAFPAAAVVACDEKVGKSFKFALVACELPLEASTPGDALVGDGAVNEGKVEEGGTPVKVA